MYLGLVFAGATPYVLAHAATSKQFDVKDEIERRDDLDNQPDDCERSDLRDKIDGIHSEHLWFNFKSARDYSNLVESILESLNSDDQAVNLTWNSVGELKTQRKLSGFLYPQIAVSELGDLEKEIIFVGNGLPGGSFSLEVIGNSLEYNFTLRSNGISQDPESVRGLYRDAFRLEQCPELYGYTDPIRNHILSNSTVDFERENLIISTRLARGSLDQLLPQRSN